MKNATKKGQNGLRCVFLAGTPFGSLFAGSSCSSYRCTSPALPNTAPQIEQVNSSSSRSMFAVFAHAGHWTTKPCLSQRQQPWPPHLGHTWKPSFRRTGRAACHSRRTKTTAVQRNKDLDEQDHSSPIPLRTSGPQFRRLEARFLPVPQGAGTLPLYVSWRVVPNCNDGSSKSSGTQAPALDRWL